MNKELQDHLAALDRSYADGWDGVLRLAARVASGELSPEAATAAFDREAAQASAERGALHGQIVAAVMAP